MALPAVSIDCDTSPRDIIHSGVDGMLVSPEYGIPRIAQTLTELMANPERCAQMGEVAAKVRKRFDISLIVAEWDRVLGLDQHNTETNGNSKVTYGKPETDA